jgi:hypothetical protein
MGDQTFSSASPIAARHCGTPVQPLSPVAYAASSARETRSVCSARSRRRVASRRSSAYLASKHADLAGTVTGRPSTTIRSPTHILSSETTRVGGCERMVWIALTSTVTGSSSPRSVPSQADAAIQRRPAHPVTALCSCGMAAAASMMRCSGVRSTPAGT